MTEYDIDMPLLTQEPEVPIQRRKSRTQRRLEHENDQLRRLLYTMFGIATVLLICVLFAGYEVSQLAKLIMEL